MRIGLAQINSTLGDFRSNRDKILEFSTKAVERRCDLVVFPELALFGYNPMDLLERDSLVQEQELVLKSMTKKLPKDVAVLVGCIRNVKTARGKHLLNSAALFMQGKSPRFFDKQHIPYFDVFDESRFILDGPMDDPTFVLNKQRVLVTICADIWGWDTSFRKSPYSSNCLTKHNTRKIDVVVNLSASPFTNTKPIERLHLARKVTQHFKAPFVYVNMVGAQDELIFDGGSFALSSKGKVLSQSVMFQEDINVVDFETEAGGFREQELKGVEILRQALVLGIRDFCHKTDHKLVHLGLSGGVDSALVACLAADALGPDHVTCFGLPGPYSSPESLEWARKLAQNLGVNWHEVSICDTYENVLGTFSKTIEEPPFGVLHENLQARIRALYLMAYANHKKSLLLSTGNKCELATGYSTLYGDLCGGLLPIGDLVKSEVYELARHYNEQYELIPNSILDRPPSAELRPNQRDQDTLPSYDKLDQSVKDLVESCKGASNETDQWTLSALYRSEHKRWQAPPVLKVTNHAFGRGRRFPIAHRAST